MALTPEFDPTGQWSEQDIENFKQRYIQPALTRVKNDVNDQLRYAVQQMPSIPIVRSPQYHARITPQGRQSALQQAYYNQTAPAGLIIKYQQAPGPDKEITTAQNDLAEYIANFAYPVDPEFPEQFWFDAIVTQIKCNYYEKFIDQADIKFTASLMYERYSIAGILQTPLMKIQSYLETSKSDFRPHRVILGLNDSGEVAHVDIEWEHVAQPSTCDVYELSATGFKIIASDTIPHHRYAKYTTLMQTDEFYFRVTEMLPNLGAAQFFEQQGITADTLVPMHILTVRKNHRRSICT